MKVSPLVEFYNRRGKEILKKKKKMKKEITEEKPPGGERNEFPGVNFFIGFLNIQALN